MNIHDNELARLTYKELQALASKYRVPGNIKKNSLIKVIEAAKRQDQSTVVEILQAISQNRKKRTKKIKTKVVSNRFYQRNHVYSRPSHPTYSWGQKLPVTRDEDLLSRDDDESLTAYNGFRQHLLQHNLYNAYNKSIVDPNIMSLRKNDESSSSTRAAVASTVQLLPLNLHRSKNLLPDDISAYGHELMSSHNVYPSSLLLKKVLQAPAGTNLREIVSLDPTYRRNWSNEDQNASINYVDDSDTETADSGSNDDMMNNNNGYFNITEPKQLTLTPNPNVIHQNIQETHQMNNNYALGNLQHYRYGYQSTEVQQNCQKWLNQNPMMSNGGAPAVCDQTNHEQMVYNDYNHTRMNAQSIYQYHENPQQISSYNNNNQMSSTSSDMNSYYPTESNAVNLQNNHANYYNYNQSAHEESDVQDIYKNGDKSTVQQQFNRYDTSNYKPNLSTDRIQNEYPQDYHPMTYRNDIYHNGEMSTVLQQFNRYDNSSFTPNPNSDRIESEYSQLNYSQDCHQPMNYRDTATVEDVQCQDYQGTHDLPPTPAESCVIEPYWPHWSPAMSPSFENILNLSSNNEFDAEKLEQTSSIYCYKAPITTAKQLTDVDCVCSQEKGLWTDERQHLFVANHKVYNDTTEGLRMANSCSESADNTDDYRVLELYKAEKGPVDIFDCDKDYKLEIFEDESNKVNDKEPFESGELLDNAWILNYEEVNGEK